MKILACIALVLSIIVLLPFAIAAVGMMVELIKDRESKKVKNGGYGYISEEMCKNCVNHEWCNHEEVRIYDNYICNYEPQQADKG